ncbi:MerR family transcriptional regulator [Nocardioides acrostichi]|uniref:MerR family transcriptional regulator n=1 Tax=Nocardioides acrostichi TaxID=2784339 RepID=A0A930UZ64_9ACTN|nr:MerR family transcriptional regulator [Nocardioides acrostichi]MBF4162776.1 MerR family transcriptional regulator [Nocardioides acrostichi]
MSASDLVSDSLGDPGEPLLTVDELAGQAGLTVRTTRYYATLGLLPPPERRGRLAYYGPVHRARLELVTALQEHGFTLQAIERYVNRLPADAGVEELALQRAMLTSWTSQPPAEVDVEALDELAGRPLTDDDRTLLIGLGLLEELDGGTWSAMPNLQIGLDLLALDIPHVGLVAATEAIGRHMTALAAELTEVLRDDVLAPYRAEHSPAEAERLQRTLPQLRRLTLEAVVASFQRAANDVITRSLAR